MKSSTSTAPVISINKLEQAFDAFNELSAELDSSYRKLEARVSQLNDELAASNSARIKELTAKEKLAAKLSALMEALPAGVIILDRNDVVKEENPQAIQILGEASSGCRWSDILQAKAGVSDTYEGELAIRNGKHVALTNSQWGEEGECIIVITDVSENHRLNTLVTREEKLSALGEMAARLAHQIRTPLSAAMLYVSHLAATGASSDAGTATVTNIRDRLSHIEKLVEGMLSYLRGEFVTTDSFSPAQLLVEVEAATAEQVKAAGGILIVDTADCEESVQGNQEALFNALSNLVENAILCAEQSPFIRLSAVCEQGNLIFSVTDNGPGVEDDLKESIFDPFFSTRSTGTGLGLAVVASVARAHGGKAEVDNIETGGACFRISIPLVEHVAELEPTNWACGLG